jgi:hypothetical protein
LRRDRKKGCGVGRGAVNIGSLDQESGEIIQLAVILNELALALLEIVAQEQGPLWREDSLPSTIKGRGSPFRVEARDKFDR